MKINNNQLLKTTTQTNENKFLVIFRGIIISIILTIILLLLLAIILTYTNMPEKLEFPIIIFISVISIILGSIVVVKKTNGRGIILGGLVGFIYIFIIYLLSSIFVTTFSLNKFSIVMIVVSIITGALTGRIYRR